MQPIEQLNEQLCSLEIKRSKIDGEIHALTDQISAHHKKKRRPTNSGGMSVSAPQIANEWRRISFALHQRRSELKKTRDLLCRSIAQFADSMGQMDYIEC